LFGSFPPEACEGLRKARSIPIVDNFRYLLYSSFWLRRQPRWVKDHAAAVWLIMRKAESGECFNIGGDNQWENIRLLERLIEIVAGKTGKRVGKLKGLITHVTGGRPGHDRRYVIDCSKIKRRLGWRQSLSFDAGLEETVDWYLTNSAWIEHVRSGAYRQWIDANYGARG
jgi:dTDP-glucose 4,6-dehydratase